MHKNYLLKAIQKKLIRLSLKLAISKRVLIILGTLLAGKVVEISLFGNDEIFIANISNLIINLSNCNYDEWVNYYTKYTISFIRSFLVLILCSYAIVHTKSKRLSYGLNLFIIISMGCDLLSVMSPDIYYAIRPYRYTNYINFRDLYSIFEVLCVIWTIAYWTFNYLSYRAFGNTVMDDDSGNLHSG